MRMRRAQRETDELRTLLDGFCMLRCRRGGSSS